MNTKIITETAQPTSFTAEIVKAIYSRPRM